MNAIPDSVLCHCPKYEFCVIYVIFEQHDKDRFANRDFSSRG